MFSSSVLCCKLMDLMIIEGSTGSVVNLIDLLLKCNISLDIGLALNQSNLFNISVFTY